MTRDAPDGSRPGGRSALLGAGLVALVAFGLFAPTLGHDLVWDDTSLVALVERTVGEGGLGALLAAEFVLKPGEHTGYYRPVVLVSLWVDARLSEAFARTYHLTNVLLHTAVSVLVLLLLRRLAGSRRFALAGGLLFAAHPVHTEAVAFVSGRTDLWAALFVLLSALGWAQCRDSGASVRSIAFAGSLAGFLAAVLSKEVALMLPAVLLAWDALGPASPGSWWARNRAWLGGWLLVVAVAALLRWGVADVPLGLPVHEGGRTVPLLAQPALLPGAVTLYLRLLVIPWPLDAFYHVDDLALGWVSVLAAAALLVACSVLASRRHGRVGLLSLAWVVLFLAPVLGAVPIRSAPIAERFLYLPSVGLALAASALLGWWARSRPRPRGVPWAASLVVVALFGTATVARSAVWRDASSLFGDLERTSPEYVARGKSNLGVQLQRAGRHADAVVLFREAVALDPGAPEVRNNLGTSLLALGRAVEAEAEYRRALEIRPELPEPRFGLGMALLRQGRVEEAAAEIPQLERGSPRLAAALRGEIERDGSRP